MTKHKSNAMSRDLISGLAKRAVLSVSVLLLIRKAIVPDLNLVRAVQVNSDETRNVAMT